MPRVKKTAVRKVPPARKKATKSSKGLPPVVASEKQTHKLPPAGAQAIIDLTVAGLLAEERQNAMQVEVLRIRARESAAKYPEHVDGETERILQELERRS